MGWIQQTTAVSMYYISIIHQNLAYLCYICIDRLCKLIHLTLINLCIAYKEWDAARLYFCGVG